jgi:hypothetical protein
MSRYLSRRIWFPLLPAVLWPTLAIAQDAGSVPLRCETFCSQSKLRTASARLTWVDPTLQPGGAAASGVAGATLAAPPQLDVTVVRNGFNTNAYATFSTAETGASPSLNFTPLPAAAPRLRAYDLRIAGTLRPAITGAVALDEAIPGAERRETSLLIENLEPGLRYTWLLRFNTGAGEQLSTAATCVAPVCPADMKE